MINNYLEEQYKPCHKVYEDQKTRYAIYLGDIESALNKQFITQTNIKTVVTAALGMDHVSFDNNIKHIVYPVLDAKSENISKFFTEFAQLIDKQISNGNILVHCFAGISRSATLVISYLMKKQQISFKQAIEFVRKSRNSVCPNYGFQMQLKQFQKQLKYRQKTSKMQRRNNSKTSQPKPNRFYKNIQFQLPQIGFPGGMNQSQFKSKVLENNIKDKKNSRQIRGLNQDNQSSQGNRIQIKPVIKPRSLSHAEKKRNFAKNFRKIVNPMGELRLSVLNRLGINQVKLATERIPTLRIGRKISINAVQY